MEFSISAGKSCITLVEGDITNIAVDAIVNAANENLILGSGVAGAIRTKGGPQIQTQCDRIGFCPTGSAVITTAGNLKAKFVIHAVGPVMGQGREDQLLASATISCLKLAQSQNLKSIAFCAISTGVFGFPLERCAQIMLGTIRAFLDGNTSIEQVIICLWGQAAFEVFKSQLLRD